MWWTDYYDYQSKLHLLIKVNKNKKLVILIFINSTFTCIQSALLSALLGSFPICLYPTRQKACLARPEYVYGAVLTTSGLEQHAQ